MRSVPQDGQELRHEHFWFAVVELIDEHRMEPSLRQQAVQKILCSKRLDNIVGIKWDIEDWFNFVGQREKELQGIHDRGDFWCKAPHELERMLWEAQREYCWMEDEQALEMSLEDLAVLVLTTVPSKSRADSESQGSEW